jgi:RimJ/RimL family protein N-acetyltransferase
MKLVAQSIYLRPITLQDVNDNYLSWLLDPEVMQGISSSGYSKDNLKAYVDEKINDKDVAFFAICSLADNRHIGNIKIDFHEAKPNVSELGLLIGDKNYWGKGIGYEACKLAIEYAFDVMKLRKLFLAVYSSNPKAKKLYEKLGFTLEGTLREHVLVNGTYVDKHLMGIFKYEMR